MALTSFPFVGRSCIAFPYPSFSLEESRMLRYGMFTVMILGTTLLVVTAQEGGALKSGPQVGKEVPGPFHPLNVTGEHAGKKACLYCSNGINPVAVVFAREANPAVAKLLKQLDEATVKNAG